MGDGGSRLSGILRGASHSALVGSQSLEGATLAGNALYDSGSLNFVLRRKTAKAQFVRVPPTIEPRKLVSELDFLWMGANQMKPPGLILRITGSRDPRGRKSGPRATFRPHRGT